VAQLSGVEHPLQERLPEPWQLMSKHLLWGVTCAGCTCYVLSRNCSIVENDASRSRLSGSSPNDFQATCGSPFFYASEGSTVVAGVTASALSLKYLRSQAA
jgi:hypothetical protein